MRPFDETITGQQQSLLAQVRDWSNRDIEALPDAVIRDALRFAADTAYRELMIAPFERTITYVIQSEPRNIPRNNSTLAGVLMNNSTGDFGVKQATLPIPADLSKYLYVRKLGIATLSETNGVASGDVDSAGNATVYTTTNGSITHSEPNANQAIVFNEKTDTRTFYDITSQKTSTDYWTRHGANTIIAGYQLSDNDIIELHYYRRLPDLAARYDISAAGTGITDAQLATSTLAEVVPTSGATDIVGNRRTVGGITYRGRLIPNWLRDQNNQVLLFGGLHHCFDYLGEEDMSSKYYDRMMGETAELNKEDKMRTAMGGNVQINYSGYLL